MHKSTEYICVMEEDWADLQHVGADGGGSGHLVGEDGALPLTHHQLSHTLQDQMEVVVDTSWVRMGPSPSPTISSAIPYKIRWR